MSYRFATQNAADPKARDASIAGEYPYLIAEQNGIAVGYAYAHRFKERYGYRFCGDWKPGRHFPDMAAHVKRLHA